MAAAGVYQAHDTRSWEEIMNMLSKWTSLLFVLPLTALAQPNTRQPDNGYGRSYGQLSYTLGEVRMVAQDPDGGRNADGVSIAGSALLDPNFFVAGSYTSTGSSGPNDTNDDVFEAGVGLRHAFTSQVDLVGIAGLVHESRQVGNRDFGSDVGPSLTGGVRSALTPKIEVGAFLNYRSLFGDSVLGLRGEGLYHLNPNLSLLAGAGLSDNERIANLGARWYFRPGY